MWCSGVCFIAAPAVKELTSFLRLDGCDRRLEVVGDFLPQVIVLEGSLFLEKQDGAQASDRQVDALQFAAQGAQHLPQVVLALHGQNGVVDALE